MFNYRAAPAERSWALRLKGGQRIVVPATLSSYSTCVFLEREDWFEIEVEFIRKLVTSGARALDVGANLGFYTVLIARAAGATGYVWGFEPDASATARVRQSLELNQVENVTVVTAALGAKSGVAEMTSELGPEFNEVRTGKPGKSSAAVPVLTLDEYATDAGIRDVSFVKLDVEGMEGQVVRGGRAFFERESPLVMAEFHHRGHVHTEMLAQFQELAYRFWRYSPGIGQLVPVGDDAGELPWLNLFICREDRASRLASENLLMLDRAPCADRHRGEFERFFRSAPFGHRWIDEVGGFENWISDPEMALYVAALDLYAQSRDSRQPPSYRFSCLQESFRQFQAAYAASPSGSVALSMIRAATDLGLHRPAQVALDEIVSRIKGGERLHIPAPFVPASDRFEIDPGSGKIGSWCTAMILEAYIKYKFGTAWRHPPECCAMIKQIINLGFATPELERSRQIGELASGRQMSPIATKILEDNPNATLNWDYWRNAEAYEFPTTRER